MRRGLAAARASSRPGLGEPPLAGARASHPCDAVLRQRVHPADLALASLRSLVLTRPSGPGALALALGRRGDKFLTCRAASRIRQVKNLAPREHREVRGRPCPGSRRMPTSVARMAKRSRHPSERRPRWPERTSGNRAWAAPHRRPRNRRRRRRSLIQGHVIDAVALNRVFRRDHDEAVLARAVAAQAHDGRPMAVAVDHAAVGPEHDHRAVG